MSGTVTNVAWCEDCGKTHPLDAHYRVSVDGKRLVETAPPVNQVLFSDLAITEHTIPDFDREDSGVTMADLYDRGGFVGKGNDGDPGMPGDPTDPEA